MSGVGKHKSDGNEHTDDDRDENQKIPQKTHAALSGDAMARMLVQMGGDCHREKRAEKIRPGNSIGGDWIGGDWIGEIGSD
jgi:hypothetical protein